MPEQGVDYDERIKWFHQARFGIFVHWGLYSLLERGEWVMYRERIPADEYAELAGHFTGGEFDAEKMAGIAADAGAKYMVMTTRHHDGFCLFDSKVSDFTSVRTAAGRDFIGEYVEAARKAGLRVGFYYSLLDWRFPGYFEPDKYPDSARAMVEQAHAQVEELLCNYGKIDVLWYDGGWAADGGGWKDTSRAAMARFWRSAELNQMAREKNPSILINNRSGLDEDLDTPEQHVTASEPGRGWESCMTMGDSCGWGFIRNNPNFKTVPQLLQYLVTAAAGEGNYLLNIGPRGDGRIRREEKERLAAIGEWLAINGEAVYGSQRCELPGAMLGAWTRSGRTGYLHIFRWPGEEAVIPLVATKALSAKLLSTGEDVEVRQEHNGRLVFSGLPKEPPHPCLNVIRVDFAAEPQRMVEKDAAAWLEGQA